MAFFYAVNRSPTGPSPAPTPVEVAVEIVGCFSEATTVTVLGQGLVAMKNLRVGDQILTGQKNPQYESVYAFGHSQPTQAGDFLVIHTDGGPKVEVTGEHLVYLDDKAYPVRASSVRIGDKLMTPDGAIAVAKISTTTKRGLYAPLTPHGTLLVNGGIQASSYAAVLQDFDHEYFELRDGSKFLSMHGGIHLFLAPFRLYCRAALAVVGNDSSAPCQTYSENGLPAYVDNGVNFLQWVNQQSVVVQRMVIASTFPFFGVMMAFESLLFGGVLSLLLIAGLVWRSRAMAATQIKLKPL